MLLFLIFLRYVESCKDVTGDDNISKLNPIAVSCNLNIGACKLKMSDFRSAIESCNEVFQNTVLQIIPENPVFQNCCLNVSQKLTLFAPFFAAS